MYETIKTTEGERVVRMTLARPPLNVLNIAMMGEINAYLETLADRTDLCLLVIDGDPSADITCLGDRSRLDLVMKDGALVLGDAA